MQTKPLEFDHSARCARIDSLEKQVEKSLAQLELLFPGAALERQVGSLSYCYHNSPKRRAVVAPAVPAFVPPAPKFAVDLDALWWDYERELKRHGDEDHPSVEAAYVAWQSARTVMLALAKFGPRR